MRRSSKTEGQSCLYAAVSQINTQYRRGHPLGEFPNSLGDMKGHIALSLLHWEEKD